MKLQRQIAVGAAKDIARADIGNSSSRWMDVMFRIRDELGLDGFIDHNAVGVFRAGECWERGKWDIEGLASKIQEVFEEKFAKLLEPPVVDLPQSINGVPCTPDMKVLVDHDDLELIEEMEDVYISGTFTIRDFSEKDDKPKTIKIQVSGEGISLLALARLCQENVAHFNNKD